MSNISHLRIQKAVERLHKHNPKTDLTEWQLNWLRDHVPAFRAMNRQAIEARKK